MTVFEDLGQTSPLAGHPGEVEVGRDSGMGAEGRERMRASQRNLQINGGSPRPQEPLGRKVFKILVPNHRCW